MTQEVKVGRIEKGPSYKALAKALDAPLDANDAKVLFTVDWTPPKGEVGHEVPRMFQSRTPPAQIDVLRRATKPADRGEIEIEGVLLSPDGRSTARPFTARYNYLTRVGFMQA